MKAPGLPKQGRNIQYRNLKYVAGKTDGKRQLRKTGRM
jgi:hypothetical protein